MSEEHEERCDNPAECAGAFVHSFGHTLIQAPIDGVSEVVNTCAGKRVIPKIELVKRPERAEFSSGKWQAQQLGSGAGLVTGFLLLLRLARGRIL
ncbi:MAG TPA: hypothetical protein V6D17_08785 [Candidatus Obscuribacterales bacterium]